MNVHGWCQVAVSLTVSVLSFRVITRVVCVCACVCSGGSLADVGRDAEREPFALRDVSAVSLVSCFSAVKLTLSQSASQRVNNTSADCDARTGVYPLRNLTRTRIHILCRRSLCQDSAVWTVFTHRCSS